MNIRNTIIKYLFSILFLIFSAKGLSQDIPIKIISENILVGADTSFIKNVSVFFKKSDKTIVYPIFYDNEIEKLSDLKVYLKKGKRYKPLNNPFTKEEDIELDFITSRKVKSVMIPRETEAKITYNVKCDELMYFSDLRFFSNDNIDTLKYRITVPDSFDFKHNIVYKDSLNYLSIDSTSLENKMIWDIAVTPVKVKPDLLMYFGIYRNMKVPLMRTIVVPSSYKNDARKYMNDWYLQHLESRRGLDTVSMIKIDELTKGISDQREIMNTLYNYVKNNFKYVAIEIGMGAIIPTNVNEVFTTKQGDCKDLSNFLSEALNYKGIKSRIALAATYDHISDCNFPSISSANHAICIAYLNGRPIILDPTDPIHFPEDPVQSIQKRSILIINSNGGEFYEAPGFTPDQNLIRYDIDVEANSEDTVISGVFKAVYNGISGNFLRRPLLYVDSDKALRISKRHYEYVFGNQSINDLRIDSGIERMDKMEVDGMLSVKGKLFKDGKNRFLYIDFLPRLMESEDRETLLEGTFIGNPFKKIVSMKIKMNEPIETFKSIEKTFKQKGVNLFIKISNPSEFILKCDYEFTFDYIQIDDENMDATNEVFKSYQKFINEPIIFKEKS